MPSRQDKPTRGNAIRANGAAMIASKGIYFPSTAYAGFVRRFVITAVDLTALVLFGATLSLGDEFFFDGRASAAFACLWLILSAIYLVVLKASIGTAGYFITGTKIVDRYGKQPAYWRMSFRLLLCLFWLFAQGLLIDWAWSGGNNRKQTLRDLLAGTFVVRKSAAPGGEAAIIFAYYFMFGCVFVLPEVQQPGTIAAGCHSEFTPRGLLGGNA